MNKATTKKAYTSSKPLIAQIETIALDRNKPRFALYSFNKRTETTLSANESERERERKRVFSSIDFRV